MITPLLKPQEVQKILKCSLSSVYKMADNGTLPAVSFKPDPSSNKANLRFKEQDIKDFIEANYTSST